MIKLYNGNGGEVEITPSDDSYRLKELMGADEVVLKFALPDYLPISAGAYITYKGDRYEVESEDSVRMIHTENYEYTVTFSSPRAHLRRYIVREKEGEGRITFFLTAKPREHLDLIVHNLNEREAGWSVGACLDGSEKTIEYGTTNALDALQKLAEAYGTEWECEGRTLSLRKSEYHKDSPLTVSYGKGKGLLSGLERNPAEEQPVGTLYVTGTDRNIDPAKYKSKTLHLPEGGTKTVGGRTYTVTLGGRAITVSGTAPGAVEGAFTDTDVYPSREGTVKVVTIKDKEKAFVDFTDPTIPADLDFEKCLIPGREMKITFQTGMLAGRTFGAKYRHKDRTFEIVPEEIDGILMPSAPFLPKEGDRYGVFEIALPESYIRSAEGRLLDSAVQYLEGLETSRYSYRAAVDPLWLKKQWTKVGHKVRIGAYVRLAGDPITDGGATLRITGIKEYLTDPYAPEVTLSDRATGMGGLTSIIRKAVQDDLTSTREASTRTAVHEATRSYRKAEELTKALEQALSADFDAKIRPLAVHTMQVLVGDKSLQFAYVESPSSTKEVPLPLTYDSATKSLHIDQAYLQHKTLGVEVTTAHEAKDFRTWTIAPIDYSPKGTAPLYLYARVPREGDGGTFVIDTRAHDFEEEAGYYHLWSGMLTPTDDGTRWEYLPMHGFTEITPGMISSPRFTSPDGRLVIDMVRGYFRFKTDKSTFSINADNPDGVYIRGGMISVGGQNLTMEEAFEEQERKLKAEEEARAKAEAEAERKRQELEEALEGLRKSTGDEQAAMAEILGKVNKTLTSLQEQVDKEVSNWFYPGPPSPDKEPESEWTTNQDKYRHIGDTYTSVDESGEYMGKSWRYTTEYKWQEIHDTLISKALAVAAKAQTTADGKSTTYYTQPSRYSVGDSWVLPADTTVGGKVYKKGTMLFANSSSEVFVGAHWSDMLKYIDSAKLEADLRASEKKSKEAWEAYAAAKASKAGEDAIKAAKEYAEAQDAAYEERTKAYADKILTEKEQALIAAADAKANLAEKRAKAYADGKITDTEQLAIDKAAAAYKAAVKKAKEMDGEIQVGGRNLLRPAGYGRDKENTDNWRTVVQDGNGVLHWTQKNGGTSPYQLFTHNKLGKGAYTLSFKADVGEGFRDYIYFIRGDGAGEAWIPAANANATVQTREGVWLHTATYNDLPANGANWINYYGVDPSSPVREVTLWDFKLERGTVATDWTPAPEDVQAEIDAERAARETAVKEINRGLSSAQTTISTLEQAQADLAAGKLNKADLPDVQYLLSSLQDGSLSHKGGLFLANDIILSDPKSKDATAMISGNGAPGAKSIRLGIDKSGGILGGETTALSNEGTGHIGGLYFDGNAIRFGDKDSSYMQIGGTARSESEMVNASTEMQTIPLGGATYRESGTEWIDNLIIEVGEAKGISYTATLSVRADASAYQDGDDRYDTEGGSIGRQQLAYSQTTCTVKASLIVTRYRAGSETILVKSQEVTVTATAPGGRYDYGDPIPHDDLFASASKELAVTLSIPDSSVAKGDMLSLYIVTSISRYCYHPTGNSNLDKIAWASASVGDLSKRVPVDTSKPMISVTKDRAAFFYGRNSYLLLNYIHDTVLKVVGNVIIGGDIRVTGDISSGNFLVPKVLAHGLFSKNGALYSAVAYDSEPGTFIDKRLSCSRVSEGKYRLGFPAEWSGYMLAFHGTEQDSRSGGETARFVAFGTPGRNGYVYVYGADDNSTNDVAVYFQIIRMI